MRSDIQQRANGRWHGILSALGIESRFLRNRHGPCPVCDGKDRYRWDNKEGKGTFFCSNCGSGDGFKLLQNLKGWDFKMTVQQVETVIGKAKLEASRHPVSSEEQRAAMKRKWLACKPIQKGDPVDLYLRNRGIILASSPSLRFDPNAIAMVALMQAPNDVATMVHSTFLTEDGRKANVTPVRKMMHGGIAPGAAVRLSICGDEIGIAEGIETALSATAMAGIPCWAALNEGLMQKWIVPSGVKRVIIFGDNDRNYVGQSAAYILARKISLLPSPPVVDVKIPDFVGNDWNDVLMEPENKSANRSTNH